MRRLVIALLVPLALAVAGCAETVVGDGQIAEGASPTAEPTPGPTDPTDEPTSEPTAQPSGPGGGGEPADVDNGDTWLYTNGFELGISDAVVYDAANGALLGGEYGVKLTFTMTNDSDEAVDLTDWSFDGGECEGGGALVADVLDDSLKVPTGQVPPGETATFEQGIAIEQPGAGTPCTVSVTPGSLYEAAKFVFTAPTP